MKDCRQKSLARLQEFFRASTVHGLVYVADGPWYKVKEILEMVSF